MSNTSDTNSLKNLVNSLKNNPNILELFVGSGTFEASTDFSIITSGDGEEIKGELVTQATAGDCDVLLITLNGRLGGVPGVTEHFPYNEKLNADKEVS